MNKILERLLNIPCLINNAEKTIRYDIKSFSKNSYTNLVVEWAKGNLHKNLDYDLEIGNLIFSKVDNIKNYVNGMNVLNIYVKRMICEYDKKEHRNILLYEWVDTKTTISSTFEEAKEEILKSTKQTVVYIGNNRVKFCSWWEW